MLRGSGEMIGVERRLTRCACVGHQRVYNIVDGRRLSDAQLGRAAVSYTHLTLPTILRV